MTHRELFLQHVAQTSPMALGLEVSHADGMYIYDTSGKRFMDLNSGIAVSSLGHSNPNIISAIKVQLDKYMHTMVYGEHIQSPQVELATLLANTLSNGLDTVYFVNSGSEAVEAALKLARKHTERYEIISCKHSYHGSTIAAESLRSDFDYTSSFAPGLSGVKHIEFNDESQLSLINERTACIILEPVQAEAGVILPNAEYLHNVRKRCDEVGALMILDEIQTGFGRTGHLFAHKKYSITPDILLIAKAMGGGMPVGAVVAPNHILNAFVSKPTLGHITTFGGHPVCVAAALATLKLLTEGDIVSEVLRKEQLFLKLLKHPIIANVRSSGLMMAVELTRKKYLKHVVENAYEQGALIDYFLFNDQSFRLAPPLIIDEGQIADACEILINSMDYARSLYP